MIKSVFTSILVVFCIASMQSPARERVNEFPVEGGAYTNEKNDAAHPCITAQEYTVIEKQCADNIKHYKLGNTHRTSVVTPLNWPLRAAVGFNDCGFYSISAYVDQNTASGAYSDYHCGTNTYDGHKGTDIFTYPFHFYKMDNSQVEVIAAAPGTIIAKSDGNFDRNCATNSLTANYVVIQHSDGTRALYWHMKMNSVTTKAVGQTVVTGEYLGVVGSSGSSTGPHLHFEVWNGSTSATYNDPYSGSCNLLNANSWWAAQKPYTEPAILKASVHTTDIVTPACPATETLNESTTFPIGFTGPGLPAGYAKFYIFIRNETPGMTATMRIVNPGGSTFSTWTLNSTTTNNASYWGYTKLLPTVPGTYTFEATYNGVTCSSSFEITAAAGIGTAKSLITSNVYPNPSNGKFVIELGNESLQPAGGVIEFYNILGEQVFQSTINNSKAAFKLDVPDGIYFYQVKNKDQLISAGRLVIQ